jgi:hypothetical protein
MRRIFLAAGLVLGVAVGMSAPACKKDKKSEEKTEAAGTDTTATPQTQGGHVHGSGQGGGMGGGTGSGAQDMVNKMMHCPSAVEGATTKVETGKESVVVTITASDPAKAAEIQKRAKHLASLTSPGAAPESKHTGQGTGGGALGKCPVVMRDVTLKVEDQKDGSKVTVTPKNPATLAELGRISKDRADALAAAAKSAGDEGEDDEEADEE